MTQLSLKEMQALQRAGRLQEAKEAYLDFLEAITEETDHAIIARVYHNLGAIFAGEQAWQAAMLAYREAMALLPDEADFYFATLANMGLCYIKLENWQEAYSYYEKAFAIKADDKEVLYNFGVVCEKLNKNEEALQYYLLAIKVDPQYYEAENNVSALYLKNGNREEALNHYKALLKLLPEDEAVSHTINILSQDQTVKTSPPSYIKALFDGYADHYDTHLKTALHYQVPAALYNLVSPYCNFLQVDFTMLDLGCGTGLAAEPFILATNKNTSFKLVGVDLSQKMLDAAHAKGGYDELILKDVLTFLEDNKTPFDLIIAGDVLVYLGDLAPLFANVPKTLKQNGVFVFSIELQDAGDFSLNSSGRFSHSESYLESFITKNQLQLLAQEKIILRYQNNEPVHGLVVVCQLVTTS